MGLLSGDEQELTEYVSVCLNRMEEQSKKVEGQCMEPETGANKDVAQESSREGSSQQLEKGKHLGSSEVQEPVPVKKLQKDITRPNDKKVKKPRLTSSTEEHSSRKAKEKQHSTVVGEPVKKKKRLHKDSTKDDKKSQSSTSSKDCASQEDKVRAQKAAAARILEKMSSSRQDARSAPPHAPGSSSGSSMSVVGDSMRTLVSTMHCTATHSTCRTPISHFVYSIQLTLHLSEETPNL